MARVRQARPCSARRTNGESCGNYAIVGGQVCVAHGGSAEQVRDAAATREWQRKFEADFQRRYQAWRRATLRWQAERRAAAARAWGIPLEDITPSDLAVAAAFGWIPGTEDAPKIRPGRTIAPRPIEGDHP